MVTDVMTCRMDQGVTRMMKVREMAERERVRLACRARIKMVSLIHFNLLTKLVISTVRFRNVH